MEETNYLIEEELKIIQDDRFFKFGTDSVLLANFARLNPGSKVIDLGTGSGVIPLLLAYKHKNLKITGVEIQPEVAELARRNVILNNLEHAIKIINQDLCKLNNSVNSGRYDVVISNPPYLPVATGEIKSSKYLALARHEIAASLTDIITTGVKIVKFGGYFYLVHRSERLTEVIELLVKHNCQPKELRLVQPRQDKESDIFLLKAKKGANPGLRVKPALIMYQQNSNQYTPEVKEIYQSV